MRRLIISAAMSLDGYIAGPKGEYDWITPDPDFDFAAMFRRFDTMVVGRRTYETMRESGRGPVGMGMQVVVFSRTLDPQQHRDVRIVNDRVAEEVRAIKVQPGKDIWLAGGAMLFRNLLDEGLVDSIELALLPILLGGGLRIVPDGRRWPLKLEKSQAYASGMLMLYFAVPHAN